MPPSAWLDGYSGQSTEQLIALEPDYRVDSIVLAFEQGLDQKTFRDGDDQLSDEERVVGAVEALEREINNGGYSQFFINSSGEYASQIVDALLRIKCEATATLTQRAIDALAVPNLRYETIRNEMQKANPETGSALEKLDDLFFKAAEPLAARLFEFIKANRSAIRLP